jgi:thiamine pyridinylase
LEVDVTNPARAPHRRGPGPGGGKGLARPATLPPLRSEVGVLNVAPYQWVPQPDWFQDAMTAAWQSIHPEISLNWCIYDCYHDDPPATLDVFAFDTIFAR